MWRVPSDRSRANFRSERRDRNGPYKARRLGESIKWQLIQKNISRRALSHGYSESRGWNRTLARVG